MICFAVNFTLSSRYNLRWYSCGSAARENDRISVVWTYHLIQVTVNLL